MQRQPGHEASPIGVGKTSPSGLIINLKVSEEALKILLTLAITLLMSSRLKPALTQRTTADSLPYSHLSITPIPNGVHPKLLFFR